MDAVFDPTKIRCRITNRDHPHFGEEGHFTNEMIFVCGKTMVKVVLDNCVHGTDGCFVGHDDAIRLN
jgi:hypothetical protein